MDLTIDQALQRGIKAHKAGQFKEADTYYTAILKAQPKHPDANHNLGVLAVSVNKAEAALPLFKTALEANPKIEQFWLSYIDALIKTTKVDEAKRVLSDAQQAGVTAAKLQIFEEQLNFELLPRSHIPRQEIQTENVNSASPPQEQLTSLLEHYQNGRLSEAEKLSVKITQDFPKHQFAWKVLGAVLGATGRKSEAVDANQTAVALSPQDAKAHSNLGNTLRKIGRLDEAEVSHMQAIALKPDFAEAHSNLGITLKELGRLDEAEASYNQAIALKPDFAKTHYNLGNTLRELGRLEEAEACYRQAIALKPDYAEAHSNLGLTFKELGKLDEAEASYTQAIVSKPDFAPAFSNRSYLLLDKGDYEAALVDADACILAKKSRALPLISLYALGRVGEIYRRLEIQSKSDAENMNLAAFATFIAAVEKKPTAYNFCPNPIDFIHIANLSSHISDSVAYVEGIIEELHKIKTIWEPSEKSTVSGFQSLNGLNLFQNPAGKIAQLKSIIINEIETYHLKFQNEECSYIQKFPNIRNLFGWTVILRQQGYQSAHIHSGGWLSGVIYLKVVPSLGKDEGAIEFGLNSKYYHDVNSPSLIFQPKVGDMVFSLRRSTTKRFRSQQIRTGLLFRST